MNLPDGPLFRWLAQHATVLRVKALLRRFQPWGQEGMNAYDVVRFFLVGLVNGAVATRAAAISFRLFLAFFPAVIFVLSVLPHTPLETEAVMDALRLLFPGDTVSLFEQTVEDLLSQTQGALLSVGFILSLYYASSSVHAVLSGFNESALLEQKGNPWLIRVWSMFLLILLVVLLGLAVLLIGFSGDALMWASDRGLLPGSSLPWFNAARWLGALVLIYSSVTLLYNVGHWDRLKWRTATPGAAMTTILMVLLSVGFSFFIAKVNTYNRLYGSLGTLLLLLVWVNANSAVLLLGFELDASIERARREAMTKFSGGARGGSEAEE
ncbi:MAG TPA: hypothetical protein DEP62_06040 [Flavobacteriales bacterium]|jgi:membrane protein|nr:hypothetical protein [Crocinitomicaceae bacterium]MEE2837368.1 YihY/virulence factor BrkB family protein [Bacteroidota bacterium]HCC64758.1 hypothetical protein [Flavobacteriales bacterium]